MAAGATTAPEELRRVLPEVHSVTVTDQFVEVRSAGLSLRYLGPFQSPPDGSVGVRDIRFLIPRHAVAAPSPVGPGMMGIFLNGAPLYNRLNEASYLGQNIWHFDQIAYAGRERPLSFGALEAVIAGNSGHSPLLGFAADGYPIYGPWGFAGDGSIHRMTSSYRLRSMRERTTLADGTKLTPGQYGPPVSQSFPLGAFAEDYEHVPGSGDLDASNGKTVVTPDYPQGTYAYFLSVDGAGHPAFPYLLGESFHGRVAEPVAPSETKRGVGFTIEGDTVADKPVTLKFLFPARTLETFHERTVHLMVVSRDLQTFDHIHPQWTRGGWYEVSHTFTRGGNFRLYADFILPGEAERVEWFDVSVKGASVVPTSVPSAFTLHSPAAIRTGQDNLFSIDLHGATIEPYLGAWAHFVLIDEGMRSFIHAHPSASAPATPDPKLPHIHGVTDQDLGPAPARVSFTANFERAGRYRLWAQFQQAGKAVVVPFDISVGEGRANVTQTIPAGAIELRVGAKGFMPARLDVPKGKPVRIAVVRSSEPNCGSRIVFPTLGIERELPIGKVTLIDLPAFEGSVSFSCGMGMYRGMIVAVMQR